MVTLTKPPTLEAQLLPEDGLRRIPEVREIMRHPSSTVLGKLNSRVELRMASLRHAGSVVRGRLVNGQTPLVAR